MLQKTQDSEAVNALSTGENGNPNFCGTQSCTCGMGHAGIYSLFSKHLRVMGDDVHFLSPEVANTILQPQGHISSTVSHQVPSKDRLPLFRISGEVEVL